MSDYLIARRARAMWWLALATVMFGAVTGCGRPVGDRSWVGGPVTPSPIPVSLPSLAPVGLPTGVVTGDYEMILTTGDGSKLLQVLWRHLKTGQIISPNDGFPTFLKRMIFSELEPPIHNLRQITTADEEFIEYGSIGAAVDRITIEADGKLYEATFASWEREPSAVLFWIKRRGTPLPSHTRLSNGDLVPLAPELYPLLTAYNGGAVVVTNRIRPLGAHQK